MWMIIMLKSNREHNNPLIKSNEAFDICMYSIVNYLVALISLRGL